MGTGHRAETSVLETCSLVAVVLAEGTWVTCHDVAMLQLVLVVMLPWAYDQDKEAVGYPCWDLEEWLVVWLAGEYYFP